MDFLENHFRKLITIGCLSIIFIPIVAFVDYWVLFLIYPTASILIFFGIIGWLMVPKIKVHRAHYATYTDYVLGVMWEKFIPQFWVLIITIGVMAFSYLVAIPKIVDGLYQTLQ